MHLNVGFVTGLFYWISASLSSVNWPFLICLAVMHHQCNFPCYLLSYLHQRSTCHCLLPFPYKYSRPGVLTFKSIVFYTLLMSKLQNSQTIICSGTNWLFLIYVDVFVHCSEVMLGEVQLLRWSSTMISHLVLTSRWHLTIHRTHSW